MRLYRDRAETEIQTERGLASGLTGFSSADAGLACIERHAFYPVRLYRDRDTERGLVSGLTGFSSADAGLACVEECLKEIREV